jgi:uncharacterized protein (DUF3084 family)
MNKRITNIIIIFLTAGIIFGAWRLWVLIHEMQETKEHLSRMDVLYKGIMQKMETAYQNHIITLDQKINALENDNSRLTQEKKDLEQKLVTSQEERQVLESKLHSIKELRKAIALIKLDSYNERVKQHLAERERQKQIDAQELAAGNRGFLIRNRLPTYKPVVRIEVTPVN